MIKTLSCKRQGFLNPRSVQGRDFFNCWSMTSNLPSLAKGGFFAPPPKVYCWLSRAALQSCPTPGLCGRLIHVCSICVASRSTRMQPHSRYSVPSRATQQHVHSHVCSNVIGAIFADCVAQASVTGTIFADCVAQQASLEQSLQTARNKELLTKYRWNDTIRMRLSLKRYRIVGRVEH